MAEAENNGGIPDEEKEKETPDASDSKEVISTEVEQLKKQLEEKEKELSKAIRQKLKAKDEKEEEFDKRLEVALSKRELASLKIGDDLKTDLEAIKKIKNYKTYSEAMEDPIMQVRIEEVERKKRNLEAGLGNESGAKGGVDYSKIDIKKLDPNNKEDQEKFKKAKKANQR